MDMEIPKDCLDLLGAGWVIAQPAAEKVLGIALPSVKTVLDMIYKKRHDQCQEVMVSELRHVDRYEELSKDPEGFVAKAARCYQAAVLGAAQRNLRILVRLMVGSTNGPAFPADEFLALAGVIESLRHDELIVLAAFLRERKRREKLQAIDQKGNLWPKVEESLKGTFTEEEILGLATALTRTGFIVNQGGFDGGAWTITPLLTRLEQTVQFNDVLAQEHAQAKG